MLNQPPVKDSVLRAAIELKTSECYGSLSVANMLGGSPSAEWTLARANKLIDLIAEAQARDLDLTNWKTVVCKTPVLESPAFIAADMRLTKLHGTQRLATGWFKDGVFLGQTADQAIEALFA